MAVAACANSQDCAIARRGPGRGARGRGSNPGSRVCRANELGWPPCWLVCSEEPSSTAGGDGYTVGAKQLQAAFAFTAIPTSHRVPPARDATLVKRRVASAGGSAWPRYPLTHMLVPAI